MSITKAQKPPGGSDGDPELLQHTVLAPAVGEGHTGAISDGPSMPTALGSYRLRSTLGEGGLGRVFMAESADGRTVAIKVLHPHLTRNQAVVRRFEKEARLMREVAHPNILAILDVGEFQGFHFLVLEFVAGPTLHQVLNNRQLCPEGRLPERVALCIIAKAAQAVAVVHQRGIVHRDLKPENIMLTASTPERIEAWPADGPDLKICDFGLARQVVQSESLHITREGMPIGSYLFMAPEQAAGRADIDQRADVYSLGATLFLLLTGRPPFVYENGMAIMQAHVNEPAPSIRKWNADVSEAACEFVARALAKAPRDRPADAEQFADEIQSLLRGEPASAEVHPILPATDPNRIYDFDWSWDLDATPEQLWPFVANTERLNRAIGLPAVDYRLEPGDRAATEGALPEVQRVGQFRKAGVTNEWREYPFEWIEGKRLGVLREYKQGVFEWFASVVEFTARPGGGTRLRHRVRVVPSGLVGRIVVNVEIGFKGKRRLEAVYRRIDAFVCGKLGSEPALDAFEPTLTPSRGEDQRFDPAIRQLIGKGIDSEAALRFINFLLHAPTPEVSRIRPIALARRLGLSADRAVELCLRATRAGLLVLLWDILCPICRTAASIKETLQSLRNHDHCKACHLDFAVDFSRSVEMIFAADPKVREVENKIYCIGGPANFPHIAAQMRVGPGETMKVELNLGEGAYRLTSPQLPHAREIRVASNHPSIRATVNLINPRGDKADSIALRPGVQQLILENEHTREILIRIERTIPRDDVLTAAQASTLAIFRELFPGEVLSAGQLVSVAAMTFLVAELSMEGSPSLFESLGDGRAFTAIHGFHRLLADQAKLEHGAIIRSTGESFLLAYTAPASALCTARSVAKSLCNTPLESGVRCRFALHSGPALAATLSLQLDYFGETVARALRLPSILPPDSIGFTDAIRDDADCAAFLASIVNDGDVQSATHPFGSLHQIKIGNR